MRSLFVTLALTFTSSAFAAEPTATPTEAPSATPTPEGKKGAPKEKKTVVRCDAHGVNEVLCTRCNPKLAPAFKSKGDWCGEHERPESQCAICNPKLEKEGVKP